MEIKTMDELNAMTSEVRIKYLVELDNFNTLKYFLELYSQRVYALESSSTALDPEQEQRLEVLKIGISYFWKMMRLEIQNPTSEPQ